LLTQSNWRSYAATLRLPVLLLTVETCLSVAFIAYFAYTFKISFQLIAVHLPFAFALFAFSIFAPGLLLFVRPVRQSRLTRHLLGAIPGLIFASIGILYATDRASYFWLGYNINYRLVQIFIEDWRQGEELVRLSRSIYVSVIVFVAVVVAIHVGLAGKTSSALENFVLPTGRFSLFKTRRIAFKTVVVIASLLIASVLAFGILLRRAPYSELLSSDPFIAFVRRSTSVSDPNYPMFADKVRAEDARCRSAYPRMPSFEKKNVVLIIVDALRADHTQVYGYHRATTPFLKALSDAGRLQKVEFATSTCAGTFCGVMSTLASKGVKHLVPGNFKLYDLLHDQGYRTYFLLSGGHDVQGLDEAYGREMDLYFDGNQSRKYSSQDDRLIFEAFDQVPNYNGTPAFFQIHLMSVHLLGVKQDAFNYYQPAATRQDFRAMFRGEAGQWPAIINSYDNSIMQADETIKQIFDVLRQKGYLQESIVVILADHGEGLGERPRHGWGHGHWLYRENIQIPLLIYDESPDKYRNLRFATQIDVAPTIVDRLGLPVPDCWRGRSLLKPDVKTVTTQRTGLSRPCRAVIYRTDEAMYHYIYCALGKTEELYELVSDPNETRDLIETVDASLLGRLREELRKGEDE
jgi:glucan phosphoethanolaminetransferase (alkaline phosphatase superfamily)